MPLNDSLIEKLEAKICGNYTAKEAYGRGLDSGLQIAIEIIRQHTAQTSEIRVVDEERLIELVTQASYWHDNPYGNGNGSQLHKYRAKHIVETIRPYLRSTEPVSVSLEKLTDKAQFAYGQSYIYGKDDDHINAVERKAIKEATKAALNAAGVAYGQ